MRKLCCSGSRITPRFIQDVCPIGYSPYSSLNAWDVLPLQDVMNYDIFMRDRRSNKLCKEDKKLSITDKTAYDDVKHDSLIYSDENKTYDCELQPSKTLPSGRECSVDDKATNLQQIHGNNSDQNNQGLEDDFESQISILGLHQRFVEDFRLIPNEIRLHRDNEDWIITFLENNFCAIDDNVKKNLSESLLLKIGFEENSKVMRTILQQSKLLRPNHVEPIDFIKRFVADQFRYNPDLSHKCHLHKEGYKLDQKDRMESSSVRTISVDCTINEGTISEDTAGIKAVGEELRQESDHCQVTVLFHGTDIESAYDISSGGIAVSMGSQKKDFSDGKGFYLTNNYEDARNWAFAITQKPAILIYKIPKPLLDEAKKLNLFEESQSRPKWEDIVLANRSGILKYEMRKTLQQYDYIEGPVSITETDTVDSGEAGMTRKPLAGSYQLCVINKNFADDISKCLSAKVVLYNVHGKKEGKRQIIAILITKGKQLYVLIIIPTRQNEITSIA